MRRKAQQKPNIAKRTSAGLRDVLFDEIDSIRSGRSNSTRANAVAKLVSGVVETINMELAVQRHLHQFPNKNNSTADNVLGAPLVLGQEDETL